MSCPPFQRRLALVPGSDMLSPRQAQRILAEHQFSDDSGSPNHHQGHGGVPRRSPSPPNSWKLRPQIPGRDHDLCSSSEAVRHDGQRSGIVQRLRFKLKTRSTNTIRDIHRRRRAWHWDRQNPGSDRYAHKKRQPMKDSPDQQGKFSNAGSENISSMSENTSGAKRHPNREIFCPLEARKNFIQVKKICSTFRKSILIHRQPTNAPSALGRHSSIYSISPRDTSTLDSAPFRRGRTRSA